MHRPFTPVPIWLNPEHRTDSPLSPHPEAPEFLLSAFETLYRLGMSDRQVVEVTALLICLSKKDRFHVPLSESTATLATFWYLNRSKFFLECSSIGEKVRRWVELFLPRNDLRFAPAQAFWSESETWAGFFLDDHKEFDRVVEQTRCRFAQQFFGLPDTGVWDSKTIGIVRGFQLMFPKVLMPWKTGNLDGFTYKFIARSWRKKKGILV